MRSRSTNRLSPRAAQRIRRAADFYLERLDPRVLLSATSLSSYSTLVTDIQSGGAYPTVTGYVNGGVNKTSGPFESPSFAVVEFDPSNSTIFPGSNTLSPASTAASFNTSGVVAATTGGSLLGNTKYYIEATYVTASGESTPGAETSTTTATGTSTNSIEVSLPALPTGDTGENVYVGTASGGEKLVGSVASPSSTATNYFDITSATGSVSPPALTLAAPSAATLSGSSTGGTLSPSTTYYVKYTWLTSNGETTPSTEQTFTTGSTGSTNSITVNAPAAPAGTTGMRVYVGTSTGGELYNGSPASVSTTASNPYIITATDSVPSVNNSGLANPAAITSLTAYTAGGTLAKSTAYYVKYTWVSATGETLGSTESTVTTASTTSTNFLGLFAPAAPSGATAMNVYLGTATGKETLAGTLQSPSTTATNYFPIISPPAFTALSSPTATVTPPTTNKATVTAGPKVTFVVPTSGGTLAASTTYYVEYTWTTAAGGETTVSSEASFTTGPATSTNSIPITLPSHPTGVTGAKIYVGTTSGGETYLASTTATTYTITGLPANGAAVAPTLNNAIDTALPTSGGVSTSIPTNLSLSLVNNPDAFNSTTGATGDVASGSFDIYLLPTYVVPVGPTAITYVSSTASGLPLGLQGQGGLSGVVAGNYLLGTVTPTAAGIINVPLSFPTSAAGVTNAEYTLTNDLNLNTKFEIAIVPHTTTSYAQFEGEYEYSTVAGGAANHIGADGELDESPQLSLTTSVATESFSIPYSTISVNDNNVSNVVEIDVNRTGYAGDAATVSYTTANGTATAGTDFGTNSTPPTGTVSFAAGQTTAVISIPTINANAAPDRTFTVTLSGVTGGTNASLVSASNSSTVTIIGTTNGSETIGGSVPQELNFGQVSSTVYNSFVLGTSATSIEVAKATTSTYAAVNGSVTNGTDQFNTQEYTVMNFNANALQQSESVTGLSSISLELDNYNSLEGTFDDVSNTPFPSPNPEHYGNFNVYLLNASVTSTPTSGFAFEGQDVNGGGLGLTANPSTGGQGTPILLGTASFSNQNTVNSPLSSSLGNTEGVQDIYTFDLSAAAQSALIADLNSFTTTSPGQIRLAITSGSASFAADFANNNSGTGGNYGIQPYMWFNGTQTVANLPPENFAINYSTISVNANETGVEVDVARSASGFVGDTATVNFSLTNGTAVLGTDYTAPSSYTVTIAPNKTVGTVFIPLIANASATVEKSFTMSLTGASTSGDTNPPTWVSTPTTITLTPPVAPTVTVAANASGAAETNSTALFGGYAYINGSVTNGTGSFAFQGYQVLEFLPSAFVQPGQQLTSLSDFSLGLANYENQQTAPGSNYGGPPGDFTLYIAGDDESALEQNGGFLLATAAGGDPATYNANAVDGIGGFTGTGVGPLSATTVGPANTDDAIPIGTFSFNTKLGLDYYTPTQAALNTLWSVNNPATGAPETVSALTFLQQQINAGDNVRILAAPGNSAFHAYFWGANTGASGSGGADAPQLEVKDAVSTTKTSETVAFGAASYNVLDASTTMTVPVSRTLLNDSGTGFGDTLTVNYATTDGNALHGTNYTTESGTLTFAPGVTVADISIPITYVASLGGDKAFTITLSSPKTSDTANVNYVNPTLGVNATTTVFITDSANNAETLTQYTSSVGDIGTNGPVTFGSSAVNPAPPFNFSIYTGGKYSALDFNDSSVINYNDPDEFNGPTGPLTPTGPTDGSGNPTYQPNDLNGSGNNSANNTATDPTLGIGTVTYTPTGDGSLYTSTISAINQITLSFVNYYATTTGALLNVYLVSDATTNILPGAAGTSKNPHYYDTSTTPDSNGYVGAPDGVGTQFGSATVLGTISSPPLTTEINFSGYTTVPLTAFSAAAEATLISDLNNGTKFRLIVAPEQSSTAVNADWIYGYTNENASYSLATGQPINYYIQPELRFDVSYTSSNAPLPAYITPSANADYVYDSTTGNLTVTNGTLTVNSDPASDTTDLTPGQLHITVSGPTAFVYLDSNQLKASGVTTANGGTAVDHPVWFQPASNAVYAWSPTTETLQITAGSGTIISDPAASLDLPLVSVTGATSSLVISNTVTDAVHLGSLSLTSGATGQIASLSTPQAVIISPSVTDDLSIDSTSKLDIGINAIDLDNGTASATDSSLLGDITALVTTGFGGGTWTGGGIYSSSAASDSASLSAVGVATGGTFAGTTLGKQTPSTYDVVIRDTYYGDANLDGQVDGSDYTKIDAGFNSQGTATPLTGWVNGDFNYDGVIDGSDYTLIDNVFNTQGVKFATPTASIASPRSSSVFSSAPIAVAIPDSVIQTSTTSIADLLKDKQAASASDLVNSLASAAD